MASIGNVVSSPGLAKTGSGGSSAWNSNLSLQPLLSSAEKFENALKLAQTSGLPTGVEGSSSLPVAASSGADEAPNARQLELSAGPLGAVKTYGQLDAESLTLENKRALQGLEFGSPVQQSTQESAAHNSPGGIILDGWSRLRSIFDQQTASLNSASSHAINGTERLIATQIEIAKYSLLMDVTSKLTGKFTQGVDTLLKG